MQFTTSGTGLKPLCSLAKCSSTADDWLDTRWDMYSVYWRSGRFWTRMLLSQAFEGLTTFLPVCVRVNSASRHLRHGRQLLWRWSNDVIGYYGWDWVVMGKEVYIYPPGGY